MKSRWIRVSAGLALVVCTFILIVVSSCGGKKVPVSPGQLPNVSPLAGEETPDGNEFTTSDETALSEVLAELGALPLPEGADAAVFEELKSALRDELTERYGSQIAVKPPTGEANRVTDLAIADSGDGTYTLTWTYKNVGDYDQNGIVNVSDLTPLAVHFDESADETNEWIDGNSDRSINIADVTPLAANLLSNVAGYAIVGAETVDSNFTDLEVTLLTPPEAGKALRFEVPLPETELKYIAVVPFGVGGLRGERSSVLARNLPPVAIADAEPTAGGAPLTVSLFSSDSYDPDGEIVKYEWDFQGEGTFDWESDTPEDVEYTYGSTVNYNATLRVTDAEGATSVDRILITVGENEPPVAVAEASPTSGDAPLSVVFYSSLSSDPDGEVAIYAWDFEGDGEYDWESDAPGDATHTYEDYGTYNARLRVGDDKGATDRDTVLIQVNGVPAARLGAFPREGHTPLTVSFDASHSDDPDGHIVMYEWDWDGDRETDYYSGTENTATHTYEEQGWFRATVTVTDNDGATATAGIAVTAVDNIPPVAVLTPDSTVEGYDPLTVTFDAGESYDEDGDIVKFEWDWEGDGEWDSESGYWVPTATHTYNEAGTYLATVAAIDDDGGMGTATRDVRVLYNAPPVVELTKEPAEGPAPLTVNFDASASYDPDGTIVKYEWDWDGGMYDEDSGNNPLVSQIYGNPGIYQATARATDDRGEMATDLVTVRVDSSEHAWVHTWGASGHDEGHAVAVDQSGSILVAGEYRYEPEGLTSLLVLGYSAGGQMIRARTWTGEGRSRAYATVLDDSGNLYVAGEADTRDGFSEALLLKYDAAGNLLWARTWGGDEEDKSRAAALDSSGNLYVAGHTFSFGAGSSDALLLKYDSDGNLIWARTWGRNRSEYGNAVAVDANRDVYVTGITQSFGSLNRDVFLLKFDSVGNLVFQRTWDTGTGEEAWGVAVGPDDNVSLTGTTDLAFGMVSNLFLLRWTGSGQLVSQGGWRSGISDSSSEGYSIVVDDAGAVHIGGRTTVEGGSWRLITLRWNETGDVDRARMWLGSGRCEVRNLVMDDSGMLYIAGIAPNATGDWEGISGEVYEPEGWVLVPDGMVGSPEGMIGGPEGIEGTPDGVEDLGGGGTDDTGEPMRDVLVIKYDPS